MFRLGIPAKGSLYFQREEYWQVLKELEHGHNVILLGPRRSGKTSLIMTVENELRERLNNTKIIYSDLRGERNIWSLLSKVSAGDRFTSILGETRYSTEQNTDKAHELTREVFEKALEDGGKIILLLDEVGYFLNDDHAGALMIMFLDFCARHPKITLLLSGEPLEINQLISHLRRATPDFQKHFLRRSKTIALQPLTRDQITEFIKFNLASSEARDNGFSESDLETVASMLAPAWPFEVAIVMNALEDTLYDDDLHDFNAKLEQAITLPLDRMFGGGSIEMLLENQLPKREIPIANMILDIIASSDRDLTIEGIFDEKKSKHAGSELSVVAKHLKELGIVRFVGEKEFIKPATGLYAYRLKREYSQAEDLGE